MVWFLWEEVRVGAVDWLRFGSFVWWVAGSRFMVGSGFAGVGRSGAGVFGVGEGWSVVDVAGAVEAVALLAATGGVSG
ncbi:hypothetical protein ACLVWO_36620, partial [Streptomyces sp. CWNU-52H]|uniref:hypothetical protein n=1 Tax=Streptomyces sp. CWNU-52H TaxID=3394352 RepID=UPI0039BFDB53